MSTVSRIFAPRVSLATVLAKTEYFTDVQLWPLLHTMNPARWLDNFLDSEKEVACHLLNAFVYFSSDLLNELFTSAFRALSVQFYSRGESFLTLQSNWRAFVDTVVITYVTGEEPSPADSGYAFARRARQLLGITEDRIMQPDKALEFLMNSPGPVVFVDDFVGSGNQFLRTWHRSIEISGSRSSFAKLATVPGCQFFYCPILCTAYGLGRLNTSCPEVQVAPAHLVSDRYSVLHPQSYLWPEHLGTAALDIVRSASFRAGLKESNGSQDDWRGFHSLGLTIGLGDTVPDATLPIFYWEANGWVPLIRRR